MATFFTAQNTVDPQSRGWDKRATVEVLDAATRRLLVLEGEEPTAMRLYELADLCATKEAKDMLHLPPAEPAKRPLGSKIIGMMLVLGSLAAIGTFVLAVVGALT